MDFLHTYLTPENTLLLTGCTAVLWMLYEYLHRKQTKRAAFLLGTLSGPAVLLLLHFFGSRIGFAPPLTVWTASVSAAAGIPGVLLLALLHFLI